MSIKKKTREEIIKDANKSWVERSKPVLKMRKKHCWTQTKVYSGGNSSNGFNY